MELVNDAHRHQHKATSYVKIWCRVIIDKRLFYINFFDMLKFDFGYKLGPIIKSVPKQYHQTLNIKFTILGFGLIIEHLAVGPYCYRRSIITR